MQSPYAIAAMSPVVEQLERMGVRYYVGGSFASSAYGHMRTTQDVDLVADLAQQHAVPLVDALKGSYYASLPAVSDAIARKSCFNLIHSSTSFKVDVFVLKDREYDRVAIQRISKKPFGEEESSRQFFVAAPEDIVLSKLEWYRLGNEVSEMQWCDVIKVLTVQKDVIDRSYLQKWAAELRIADLLEKAWSEVESM